jgi:NAD(P)H-hydrate epimerase
MTKGGFGDTLAGVCGAMLARKINTFESAKVAAFINGKAGEIAAEIYGEGLMASDIFKFIPKAIEEIQNKKQKSQK